MRILLVEDNADHRELMRLALTGHDSTWEVEGVVSGEEALCLLLGGEVFDLVFLDYSLPQRDGLWFLEEIRRSKFPPPVVMVTGRGDERVAVEAMKRGAYDYVVKQEDYLERLPVVARHAVEANRLALEHGWVEEALKKSGERFRTSVETLLEGFAILSALKDSNGQIIDFKYDYINKAGCKMNQKPHEEHMSKTFLELLPKHKEIGLFDEYVRVVETGQSLTKEFLIYETLYGGGERLRQAFDVRVTRLRDGFVTTWQDITDKKKGEELLRRSEERLRLLIENSKDIVIMADLERSIMYYNGPTEYGITAEEVLGKSLFSIFEPVIAARLMNQLSLVIKDGEALTFESVIPLKGESYWFLNQMYPIWDEKGGMIAVGLIARNITARKRAEDQILRQSAVLDGISKVFREALTYKSEEELLRKSLTVAEELTGSKFGWIGEINQEGRLDAIALSDPGWNECRMSQSDAVVMLKDMEIRGIWGEVLKDEQSLIVNDPLSHLDSVGTPDGHPPITSFLGIPLKHAGKTFGMIALANKELGYDLPDQEAVETLSVAIVEALGRKRAEEALRRAEENFRRSMDDSPVGVRIVTEEGETVYANRVILKIYGYDSIEELRTTPVKKRYTPESYAEFQIRKKKRQRGEYDPPEYEISIVRKNGEVRHLQVFRKEVLWSNEKQYQIIYRDITERKQAEEALQASKELFEKIFVSQRDAIFLLDVINPPTILDSNPAATEVFGYTRQEMVGRTMDFLHVDETAQKEFQGQLSPTIAERGFMHLFEFQMRRKDGKVFPTEHSVIPLEDEQGERIGWVSVVRDITEAKRAKEELMEREMFNFALFEYNPIQTIVVDLEGEVTGFNLAKSKSGDRLPNIGDVMYKDYAGKHENDMHGELMACIRSGEIKEFPEQKYGEKVLSITISPFPKGAVIISQDITERKWAEERILTYQGQLRSLASELSLIEERERRHIATELHDNISQTLAIAKIKLGMAQEVTSSTDWVGSLNEIGKLIDQAIQYTRSLTFELSPPILYELGLEAGIEWLTEQIQEKHGIQIGFEDDQQPKPMSEEIRITLFKATRELLINIVKHAQASKAKVSIWREDISIRIRVEDDGVGFSTSEGKQLRKTTGFGLFNIGERIKYLEGDMVIESEPGRGTRVTLSAPLEEKED